MTYIKSEMPNLNQNIDTTSQISFIIISLLSLTLASLFISLIHSVPLLECIKFYLAVVILLYMPGYAILKLLNYSTNPVSHLVISLITGTAVAPLIYSLLRHIDQPWVFILIGASSLFYFARKNKANFQQLLIDSKSFNLENIWWLGLLASAIILALLNYSHFNDLILMFDKSYLLRDHGTTESSFHLGIINALKGDITPSFPYLSEYNLAYHLDMHILAEMLCRFTGINSLIMTYYLLPLFYFFLIVAAPSVFFFNMTKNAIFSLLFGFSVLGGDLSFLFNLIDFFPIPDSTNVTTGIFMAPPTSGIFTMNGLMASIPLFFGSALMLDHFFKENRWQYLFLFSIFVVTAFRIKSSMGPHIIGAAAVTLAIIYIQRRYSHYWKLGLTLIFASIIISIEAIRRIAPTESIMLIGFRPLNGLTSALHNLGINLPDDLINSQPIIWLTLITLSLSLYLVGCFGVKSYFIRDAIRLVQGKINNPAIIFLLIFIISGFLLSEIVFIGSISTDINNGRWFATQSLIASGFFIISAISHTKKNIARILLTVTVIVLMFSGTLTFLKLRDSGEYIKISPYKLAISEFIVNNTPSKSIIIEPLQYTPSIASHLAGRNSFISIYKAFLGHVASPSIIEERAKASIKFYNIESNEDRSAILRRFNINYIIVPQSHKNFFDKLKLGTNVYGNSEYSLIHVINTI